MYYNNPIATGNSISTISAKVCNSELKDGSKVAFWGPS